MSDHAATTRAAILAEITHAEAGVNYWQNRLAKYERILAEIDADFDAVEPAKPKKFAGKATIQKPAPKKVKTPAKKPGRLKKTAAAKKATKSTSSSLPEITSEDYMAGISDKPQSRSEIVQAILVKKDLRLSPNDFKTFKGRVNAWLHYMTEQKKIHDQGTGVDRKFFK